MLGCRLQATGTRAEVERGCYFNPGACFSRDGRTRTDGLVRPRHAGWPLPYIPSEASGIRPQAAGLKQGTSATSALEPEACGLKPTQKRPAGVEPALPPWQGSRLPLHHGRLVGCRVVKDQAGGSRLQAPDTRAAMENSLLIQPWSLCSVACRLPQYPVRESNPCQRIESPLSSTVRPTGRICARRICAKWVRLESNQHLRLFRPALRPHQLLTQERGRQASGDRLQGWRWNALSIADLAFGA